MSTTFFSDPTDVSVSLINVEVNEEPRTGNGPEPGTSVTYSNVPALNGVNHFSGRKKHANGIENESQPKTQENYQFS
jgi:hypothetical protein